MLELTGLSKTFIGRRGETVDALEPLTLRIERGRFITFVGPSGCGKSTIFNIIAGLELPTAGSVTVDGISILGMSGVAAYMLQKDLLLPWRSVINNVILGLEIDGMSQAEAYRRARPLLERYGLGGFEQSYPAQLSGGMRQRAALLRTMLCDREVVLLDEPFGALDAQTRADVQTWLLNIWSDLKKTVVFITHDVDEAVYLSDEIVMMSARPGRIIERLTIELPRPRDPTVLTDPRFIEYKRKLLSLLQQSPKTEPSY